MVLRQVTRNLRRLMMCAEAETTHPSVSGVQLRNHEEWTSFLIHIVFSTSRCVVIWHGNIIETSLLLSAVGCFRNSFQRCSPRSRRRSKKPSFGTSRMTILGDYCDISLQLCERRMEKQSRTFGLW